MNKIKIEITSLERSILQGQLIGLLEKVTPRIAIPEDLKKNDLELAAVWQSGLNETLEQDCQMLMRIVNSQEGDGNNNLADYEVMRALRACAAIRIAIKEFHLWDLDLDKLEMGQVDFAGLNEKAQNAYLCFALLASLQEMMIDKLSSTLAEK